MGGNAIESTGCVMCMEDAVLDSFNNIEESAEWLRNCFQSIPEELFQARVFLSNQEVYRREAAACGWSAMELGSSNLFSAGNLKKGMKMLSDYDRIIFLEGVTYFPNAETWSLLCGEVSKRKIITATFKGKGVHLLRIPSDFYADVNALDDSASIQSFLSMHPTLIHVVDYSDDMEPVKEAESGSMPTEDTVRFFRENAHPMLTIRIGTDAKCFGPGIARLLSNVDRLGSLKAAAADMNMSYTKAWRIVKNTEAALKFKLLESMTGGNGGGGATITNEARQLMLLYRDYIEKLNLSASALLEEALENSFPESPR